ncbi:hypothetical protein N786_02145 [Bacillus amyloliquefaciens UASWS BA1]|nr:hypothetical protein U722_18215 [Bacillus amyloliquefaciens LFB112]ERK85121.1 hypothetical protein N786_02145 [Bacillus amyloliquefaciens UASWS BA1]
MTSFWTESYSIFHAKNVFFFENQSIIMMINHKKTVCQIDILFLQPLCV